VKEGGDESRKTLHSYDKRMSYKAGGKEKKQMRVKVNDLLEVKNGQGVGRKEGQGLKRAVGVGGVFTHHKQQRTVKKIPAEEGGTLKTSSGKTEKRA